MIDATIDATNNDNETGARFHACAFLLGSILQKQPGKRVLPGFVVLGDTLIRIRTDKRGKSVFPRQWRRFKSFGYARKRRFEVPHCVQALPNPWATVSNVLTINELKSFESRSRPHAPIFIRRRADSGQLRDTFGTCPERVPNVVVPIRPQTFGLAACFA